jgi:hypothetical protein
MLGVGTSRLLRGFHVLNHFLQDVEIHHLETPNELKFTNLKIIDKGPVRASLQADASYGKSTIKVTVRHFSTSPFQSPISSKIDILGCHYG